VRTGLAVIGMAVAVVGVGVLVVAFTLSSGNTGSTVHNVDVPSIAAHSTYNATIPSTSESSASIAFAWASTESVRVAFYEAGPCGNGTGDRCPSGAPLASWWSRSGVLSWSGDVARPWFLTVTEPNGTATSFNATVVESYVVPGLLSSNLSLAVLLAGSIVLMVIGALALFLGFFLRSGIYRGAPTPVPPPDAGILDAEGDDDFDLSDDETEDGPPDDGDE
jgi:hypothetical protein